ncbi:MAG: hypothetical protein GXP29_03325 [Planctomycetes bacterium]|nr:hypothetical protein [Planctomycetota bacterium]
MISRLSFIAVFAFWVGSMAWLVHHDVWPAWTAIDVPMYDGGDWLTDEMMQTQVGVSDQKGNRVGTIWTQYARTKSGLTRTDLMRIESVGPLPMLWLETGTDFTVDGHLDEIRLELFGAGEVFKLIGERYSGHLAFQLTMGHRKQYFKVDAAVMGTVDSMFRPFAILPNLKVGHSWRMHVFNPLAALTGVGSKLIPMLVKVTDRERVSTSEGVVDCFVIDAGSARAWVRPDGVVVRQEVQLPIGGVLTIEAEPYEEAKRTRAMRMMLAHSKDPGS